MCYPGPGLIREVAFPVRRWAERIPGRCILRVYSRGVGAPEDAVPTPVGGTVSHWFIVGVRVVAMIVLRRCLIMKRCGESLWAMLCLRVASNRHPRGVRV